MDRVRRTLDTISPATGGDRSCGTTDTEQGTILIWALMIMVLTSGMVISHATYLGASRRDKTVHHVRDNLGATFARSGLSEALSWFQNQPQQPVVEFKPVLDPEADPPRFETIDPTIGLVREFEIHGNLWGRYEVRSEDAKDVSGQRAGATPGSAWEVGVHSYVFRVLDPGVPFDHKPNQMLASDVVNTEFRTVKLNLPAAAAICIEDPAKLTLGRNAVVDGKNAAAIAYKKPAGGGGLLGGLLGGVLGSLINLDLGALVTGLRQILQVSSYDAAPLTMFRMRKDELKAFADVVLNRDSTKATRVDSTQWTQENGVVYSPRGRVLTEQFALDNVLMYVDGNLEIRNTMPSAFSGVMYVDGNVLIDAPLQFNGTLIATGAIDVGSGDSVVKIQYDDAAVGQLRKTLNKYRPRRGRSPPR